MLKFKNIIWRNELTIEIKISDYVQFNIEKLLIF